MVKGLVYAVFVVEILVWGLATFELESNHCFALIEYLGAPPPEHQFWCSQMRLPLGLIYFVGPIGIVATLAYTIIVHLKVPATFVTKVLAAICFGMALIMTTMVVITSPDVFSTLTRSEIQPDASRFILFWTATAAVIAIIEGGIGVCLLGNVTGARRPLLWVGTSCVAVMAIMISLSFLPQLGRPGAILDSLVWLIAVPTILSIGPATVQLWRIDRCLDKTLLPRTKTA